MAVSVARRRPEAPIILMYAQEIGRIEADPHGAPEMAPTDPNVPRSLRPSGWLGRNGARCAATATGPTPGPPPPCGMQKVLCRFRCDTSPPNSPGRARPTRAFRLAPSTYTWPPAACTTLASSLMVSSKTPWVDGYVTMIAARFSPCTPTFATRSDMSTFPAGSVATTTTFIPAITAEAALVP